MESETLAATVVSIIVPYVTKGAEEFMKGAGKDAYEKTKAFFDYLKKRISANKKATSIMTRFEEEPENYWTKIESILQEEVEQDSVFAIELSNQLKTLEPYIEIIQKMKTGEDVIALEADGMTSGKVYINQEIDDAKGVKGAVVKKIG